MNTDIEEDDSEPICVVDCDENEKCDFERVLNYENVENISIAIKNPVIWMKSVLYDDFVIIPGEKFEDSAFRICVVHDSVLFVIRGDNGEIKDLYRSISTNVFGIMYSEKHNAIVFPYYYGDLLYVTIPEFKRTKKIRVISNTFRNSHTSIYQIKELSSRYLVVGGLDRSSSRSEIADQHRGFFIAFIDTSSPLRKKKSEQTSSNEEISMSDVSRESLYRMKTVYSHLRAPWAIEPLKKNHEFVVSGGGGELNDKEDHYLRLWRWKSRNRSLEKDEVSDLSTDPEEESGDLRPDLENISLETKFPQVHEDRIVCLTSYIFLNQEFILSGSRDDIFVRWDINGNILNKISTRIKSRPGIFGGSCDDESESDDDESKNGGVYFILHYKRNLVFVGGGNGTLNLFDIENPPDLSKENTFGSKFGLCGEGVKIFAMRWKCRDYRSMVFLTNYKDGIAEYVVLDGEREVDPDLNERRRFLLEYGELEWEEEEEELGRRRDIRVFSKMSFRFLDYKIEIFVPKSLLL